MIAVANQHYRCSWPDSFSFRMAVVIQPDFTHCLNFGVSAGQSLRGSYLPAFSKDFKSPSGGC
jgi:hypothetical protein